MHIYIDADACPQPVKEVVYKVAERLKIDLTLVANQFMQIPSRENFKFIQVGAGADVADAKIVELAEAGDLVITQDIPLADLIVQKKAFAMSPRGKLFTEANIKERLSMRDFMTELRSFGVDTGGPPPYSDRDRQNFNNQLDKFVTRQLKK
ncbi:MAG: YaiI/YqxD family protein [Lentisphaeraceae bacterium]|nr:YaiI/YqxD family protein [Lentisphaeraceae bacterium]